MGGHPEGGCYALGLEVACGGVQTRPPRDVLFDRVNYFEPKAIETLQAQEKLLPLP